MIFCLLIIDLLVAVMQWLLILDVVKPRLQSQFLMWFIHLIWSLWMSTWLLATWQMQVTCNCLEYSVNVLNAELIIMCSYYSRNLFWSCTLWKDSG